jgi:tripeptidyl-peptidase-1
MRIALTQSNLDKAHEYLMDVSHPGSPNYGKHWTAQEVADAFAPSDITIRSVVRWLEDAGITSDRVKQSQSLNWLHADLTVEEAENLLRTEYFKYTHAGTGQSHIACEEYSIPEDVRKYVDFITPTVHFDTRIVTPMKRRELESYEIPSNSRYKSSIGRKVETKPGYSIGSPEDPTLPKPGDVIFPDDLFDELDNCDKTISPACLQALYMLPDSDGFYHNPESKSPRLFGNALASEVPVSS